MSRVIDELVVSLRYKAETKQLQQAKQLQDKTVDSTNRFKRAVGSAADASGRAFRKIGDGARKVGQGISNAASKVASMRNQFAIVAAAGVAVGLGLKKVVDSVVELGDRIGETSEQLGVSSDDYQRLAFAAERGGAGAQELDAGIRTLNKNLLHASETGSGPLVDAFDEIGLSVDQLEGKGIEDKFRIIADALQKVEDPSRRSALAMDIFGKTGTKLIPLLNQGSAGIKELGDRAEMLGIVLSKDAIEASGRYDDAQKELNATLLGLRNTLVSALIPSLAESTEGFTDFLVQNREAIVSGALEFFQKLGDIISFVKTVVTGLIETFGPLYQGFANAFQDLLPRLEEGFLGSFEAIQGSLQALSDIFGVFFTDSEDGMESLIELIGGRFVDAITKTFNSLERVLIFFEEQLKNVAAAFELFSEGRILDGLAELGNALIDAVLEPLKEITRGIVGLADSLGAGGIVPNAVREFASSGTEQIRVQRQKAREEENARKETEKRNRKNAEELIKRTKGSFTQAEKLTRSFRGDVKSTALDVITGKSIQNAAEFLRKPPRKPPKRPPKKEKDKDSVPTFADSARDPSATEDAFGGGRGLAKGAPQSITELIDQSGVEGKIGRGNAPPIVIQNFQNRFQIDAPVTISGTFGANPSQISAEFNRSIDQIFREKVRQAADSIRTAVRL